MRGFQTSVALPLRVMEHELFYQTEMRPIGRLASALWKETGELLPSLVDSVNRTMEQEGTERVISDDGLNAGRSTASPSPAREQTPSRAAPFSLSQLLSEDRSSLYFHGAAEWQRLFAWWDFLVARDAAYEAYRPVVELLRPYLSPIIDLPQLARVIRDVLAFVKAPGSDVTWSRYDSVQKAADDLTNHLRRI